MTGEAQCQGCPYRERGKGFVPGKGPQEAPLAFIGQGPGKTEVYAKEPFIGSAGQRLDIWFAKAGIPRSKVWIDNGVRCQIKVRGKDVAPRKAIEECYRRHWGRPLHEMLEAGTLKLVVAVGAETSKFLLGEWAGDRAAGTLALADLRALDASAVNGRGTNQETSLKPDTGHLRSDSEESGGS